MSRAGGIGLRSASSTNARRGSGWICLMDYLDAFALRLDTFGTTKRDITTDRGFICTGSKAVCGAPPFDPYEAFKRLRGGVVRRRPAPASAEEEFQRDALRDVLPEEVARLIPFPQDASLNGNGCISCPDENSIELDSFGPEVIDVSDFLSGC